MQPAPVFLSGESHRQRILEGYTPWDHEESDMTEATEHTHAHTWTKQKQKIQEEAARIHRGTVQKRPS